MALQSAQPSMEVRPPHLRAGSRVCSRWDRYVMEEMRAPGSQHWLQAGLPPTALHSWANVQNPVPISSTTSWPQWPSQEPSQ